jgi:hypothetical protein
MMILEDCKKIVLKKYLLNTRIQIIGHDMFGIPIILLTLIIGFILVGVLVVLYRKNLRSKNRNDQNPDYRGFFIMGICFLPMGIIFTATVNIGFIGIAGMGLIYMSLGLANRDKWKKNWI